MRLPQRIKTTLNRFILHVTDSMEVQNAAVTVLADDVEAMTEHVKKYNVDLALAEEAIKELKTLNSLQAKEIRDLYGRMIVHNENHESMKKGIEHTIANMCVSIEQHSETIRKIRAC